MLFEKLSESSPTDLATVLVIFIAPNEGSPRNPQLTQFFHVGSLALVKEEDDILCRYREICTRQGKE